MKRILERAGRALSEYLTRDGHPSSASPLTNPMLLRNSLRPADVLLGAARNPRQRKIRLSAYGIDAAGMIHPQKLPSKRSGGHVDG